MLRSSQARICLLLIFFVAQSWGAPQAQPSSTELTQKLVSGRSARTIPHRFTIEPSGISLSSDQTQHFGVTDSQGNSVAVRWSVSGLHCAGFSCGNIDAQGNFTPPTSLSQPLEITLEGVVISDPSYSVMTHVQIKPWMLTTSSTSNSGNQVAETVHASSASVVEKAVAAPSPALPMKETVAPAPSIASGSVRQQVQQPATNAIAAAPKLDAHPLTYSASSLPLPTAVASTPIVSAASNTNRQQQLAPLPNAVASAPVLNETAVKDDGTILLDVPSTLSNLTIAKKPGSAEQGPTSAPNGNVSSAKVASNGKAPALSTVTPSAAADVHPMSAPAGTTPLVRAPVPQSVVQTSPAVGTATAAMPAGIHSQPAAVISTSVPPKQEAPIVVSAPVTTSVAPRTTASISPSTMTSPAISGPISSPRAISGNGLTAPPSRASLTGVSTGITASGTTSSISPNSIAPSTAPTPGTLVTYRDGQLKIDAENITLAEVLQLVGKKMGVVIDVPPGSGQERIVEHVGPGRPNDVLTQLLNGSHFNFIIVNSAIHPNEPAEVLLSMEGRDAGTPAPMAAPPATTSSALYTPPDPTLHPLPLPPQYDPSLAAPANRDSLTPDALSELMRAKAKELRERAMQQAGVSPDTSQAPTPPPTQAPPEAPPQAPPQAPQQ